MLRMAAPGRTQPPSRVVVTLGKISRPGTRHIALKAIRVMGHPQWSGGGGWPPMQVCSGRLCGLVLEPSPVLGLPFQGRRLLPNRRPLPRRRPLPPAVPPSPQIPELDFEMTEGSLGSMFTTVEGLLQQIGQQLRDTSIATFANGDSSAPHRQAQFDGFLEDLEQMRRLEKPFTLRLVDPLGHSYCQSTRDDPADDPRLTMVPFERTAEQDEELGIDALRVQEERAPRQRAAVQRQEAG